MDVENLVLVVGDVTVDAVVELADVVSPTEFELDTGVEHLTGVDGRAGHTDFRKRGDADEQVVGELLVPLGREGQAVVEEAGVDGGVDLLEAFPLEVRIGQAGRTGTVGRATVAGGRIVLIHFAVEGNGGRVLVAVEDVDVTVETPGSAEFQEGDDVTADIVLEEGLVADGPGGGHGREVTPAGLLGELGGVVGVGADDTGHAVTVVIGVDHTTVVRQLGAHVRGVADVLGGVGGQVVDVAEVRRITLEDVRTIGGDARVVAVALGVGHTGHRVDGVLAERAVEVHEVLPLIVVARVDVGGDVVVRGLGHGRQPVGSGEAVAGVLGDAVTETGRDGQALERGEVGHHGTAEVDTFAGVVGLVSLEQRVTGGFLQVAGSAVEVVVVGRVSRDVVAGGVVLLHGARGVFQLADVSRSQRVEGDHGVQHGTVTGGDGLAAPLLDGVVGGDVEPLEQLIVSVDLGGQTLVDILLADDDTVLVDIVEGGEEMTLVVATLEGDAVLLAPAGSEHRVIPVGILSVIFVGVQEILVDVADVGLVFDVVLGAEDVGFLAQGLEGEAAVVGDAGVAVVGSAALGGDEDDTVTCLRTVDSGGGSVLQDLHGLDHGRIEVLDVIHLQTIDDEERSDRTGVRGITADTDRSTLTRSTGGVDDLDTGSLTLEGGGSVRRGAVLQVFRAHGGDGTGQVALLLDAVTDNHGLFEHLSVLLEDDVVIGLAPDDESLALVADALDGDVGSGRDTQGESSVNVRGCADAGITDHSDSSANDGLTAGVYDFAADGSVLGGSRKASERSEEYHHDTRHLHQMF